LVWKIKNIIAYKSNNIYLLKKELDQYLVVEEVEVEIQTVVVSKIAQQIFINNNLIPETNLILKLYNNWMHFMKNKIKLLK